MSLAHAHKQEVEFEEPIQTTTATTFSDVVVLKDSLSGDAAYRIVRAQSLDNTRFATVDTVLVDRESLQDQLSYTLPSWLGLLDIPIDGGKLRPKLPIYFDSTFFVDGELLRLENEELSLFVSGRTKEELMQELCIYIDFIWSEYAQEDDEKLAPSGKVLKYRLLERFEQIE